MAIDPSMSFDSTFRSLSDPSLHHLFGESPLEQFNLPTATPVHSYVATPGSLDFFDQPRDEGNRNVRRNRDPDYAYFFMWRAEMKNM